MRIAKLFVEKEDCTLSTNKIKDLNKYKVKLWLEFRGRYSQTKRGVIALTYIYGIGSRAHQILAQAKVNDSTIVSDWTDDETGRIREAVGNYKIEENYIRVAIEY